MIRAFKYRILAIRELTPVDMMPLLWGDPKQTSSLKQENLEKVGSSAAFGIIDGL